MLAKGIGAFSEMNGGYSCCLPNYDKYSQLCVGR